MKGDEELNQLEVIESLVCSYMCHVKILSMDEQNEAEKMDEQNESEKSVPMTFWVAPALRDAARARAKETGVSLSDLINNCLRYFADISELPRKRKHSSKKGNK